MPSSTYGLAPQIVSGERKQIPFCPCGKYHFALAAAMADHSALGAATPAQYEPSSTSYNVWKPHIAHLPVNISCRVTRLDAQEHLAATVEEILAGRS